MHQAPHADAPPSIRRAVRRVAVATTALAALITLPLSSIPAANAAQATSIVTANTATTPTMNGSIGMEDGLHYGGVTATADTTATSFTGTPFLMPSDGMSLFRSMTLTGNALDITIRFNAAFTSTQQYVSLLELSDNTNTASGTGKLSPARSALGIVVQNTGTVWLQTGSYAGGTDWTGNTGVRIDDGAFHTLNVRVAATGMTISMDNGAQKFVAPTGNRGTSEFISAFFGTPDNSGNFQDWRKNINTIAIGGMAPHSPLAHQAWPNFTGKISGVTITSANVTTAAQTTAFQTAMTDNNAQDASWLFVGGSELEGQFENIGTARNYVGMFEEYSRWTKAANTFGMQRYVINAGVRGQDLTAINKRIAQLIARTNPKVIDYNIGVEDYSAGAPGLERFRTELQKLAQNALEMRGSQGLFALQLPHAVPDAAQQANAQAYADAAQEVINALPTESRERILVVDHMTSTKQDTTFLTDGVTSDGVLTAAGHETIARELSERVFGTSAGFQTRSGTWVPGTAKNDSTPQAQYQSIASALRAKVDDTSEPLTWVFMGDSITHGAAHLHGYDSVSQLFEHYLKEDLGRTDDLVINTAVSGAMADGGSPDQPWRSTVNNVQARMATYQPDVVTIQLGTNDADATADSYETHLRQLVQAVRDANPNAIIILRSPTPAKNDPYKSRLTGTTGSVERMKRVANETGSLFIDQYTDWQAQLETDPSGWSADGDFGDGNLHPGPNGHLRMFRQLVGQSGLDTTTPWATLAYNVPGTPTPTATPVPTAISASATPTPSATATADAMVAHATGALARTGVTLAAALGAGALIIAGATALALRRRRA